MLPFLVPAPIAAFWVALSLRHSLGELALLVACAAVLVTPIFLLPWARLPRWADSIPPLLSFALIAGLNEIGSGATSFASLALLPVFWIALYGSRVDLGLSIVGTALLFAIPLLVHPGAVQVVPLLTRASLWVAVTASLGFSTQTLVRRVREDWRRSADIVRTSHEAFVGLDELGRVTDWNPAAELLFGWTAAEMFGRRFSEHVVPPALRDRHDSALARFVETGQEVIIGKRIELPARHKGGWDISVELTISASHTGGGWRFHAFLHDVSARHRDERRRQHYAEQLELVNGELRKADELKTHFLAMASHELRTPLTSIGGFAETMLRMWDTLSDDDKREYVGIMDTQSQRLVRLVNDLLLITRLEDGRVETTSTSIELRSMLQRSLVELSVGAGEIELDCGPDARAWADVDHLHQIVVNFVTNARRYGDGPMRVEVSDVGADVYVAMVDCGPGVPEDFVPHLFERFAQAGRSTTRTVGTGLGLSIVRGLARAQGGDAWYEPNVPRGARFVCRLPAADPVTRTDDRALT